MDLNSTYNDITNYFWPKRDLRVDNWTSMSSPWPTLLLSGMYLMFSTSLGPLLMKNRESFNLREIVVIYNVVMVGINSYLCYQLWTLAWGSSYSWICARLDNSMNSVSLEIAEICWLYHLTKFVDWIDTVLFVLKKKFMHVSFLHVYHHTLMPNLSWFFTRFSPGGHPTFLFFVNSGVHTVMYGYYALSALGPKYRKYLWWKRYITIMQMTQFVVVFFHGTFPLLFNCQTGYPLEWTYFYLLQGIVMFCLFFHFYIRCYTKPIEKKQL